MITFPLSLSESQGALSWLFTVRIWQFLEVKPTRVWGSLSLWPPRISHSHDSPHSISSNLSNYHFNSHKQKRRYLPFYKEKLPLPNKKVISQAVGLDGEVLNHPEETHGPVWMCVGVNYGQPRASCLGRLEAGRPSHMPRPTPASPLRAAC